MLSLYENLMNLVAQSEVESVKDDSLILDAFYFDDQKDDKTGKTYRIFNYRLASYTSFQKQDAKNCRGTMFDITDINKPILVSLPPEKFFNYEEGVGEKEHIRHRFVDKMEKLDGSLISTYHIYSDGKDKKELLFNIGFKSKGSIKSAQANEATKIIQSNSELHKEIVDFCFTSEATLNFEFISPENRIVVFYDKPQVVLLSARFHEDGQMLFGHKLREYLIANDYHLLAEQIVDTVNVSELNLTGKSQIEYVADIREEKVAEHGEGYVIELQREDGSNYLVKVKNKEYLELHNLRGNVDLMNGNFGSSFTDKNIAKAVLMEISDDLKSLFSKSEFAINKIVEVENKVIPKYNKMVHDVELFYNENKHLDRKDYAVKVHSNPEIKPYMQLLMNHYLNRHKDADYKEFALNKNNIEMFI